MAQDIMGVRKEGDDLFFKVSWRKRQDGVQPRDSVVDRDTLVAFDSDLLLDYYQSKVVFRTRVMTRPVLTRPPPDL